MTPLSINQLNSKIKSHRVATCIWKQNSSLWYLQERYLDFRDCKKAQRQRFKNNHKKKRQHKNSSDNHNFNLQNTFQNKKLIIVKDEHCIMIKESFHQGLVPLIKICIKGWINNPAVGNLPCMKLSRNLSGLIPNTPYSPLSLPRSDF